MHPSWLSNAPRYPDPCSPGKAHCRKRSPAAQLAKRLGTVLSFRLGKPVQLKGAKMGNTTPENDLARAKGLRNQAKTVKNTAAAQTFHDAADRLEKRAAKKVNRVGRKVKKRGSTVPAAFLS